MTVLALCDRWHQPPSVILREDATLLRMLHVEAIETDRIAREEGGDDPYGQ